MRIAYICADPGIGVFGTKGASVHVQEMVRAWRAAGHEVTLYCTRRDDAVPDDLRSLRVVTVPVGPAAGAPEREQQITAASRQLAGLAAREEYDLVYERYSLFSEAGAVLTATRGVPLVVEVNAPLIEEQRRHRVLHDAARARRLTRRSFEAAHAVSCVSDPVAEWVTQQAPAVADRVTVIPNGVNVARIRPAHRTADAPFTVGFVGTLKPWHGTEVLLAAFAMASRTSTSPWRLDVCGAGPLLETLCDRAGWLGIADQVEFRGAVAPALVPRVLQGFDVAVAPYPPGDHYFSPLKVYEYLAAGLPVVASAVGTLPDVLGHGDHGVLVRPGDAEDLARALTALADDPARRAALGARARTIAVAEHDWTLRAARVLDLVEVMAR